MVVARLAWTAVRHLVPSALLGAVLLLAGCGGDEPRPRSLPPVSLEIVAPDDASTVRDGEVEIRGRVDPANARVLVLGRRAEVSGGEFAATVPLREGANVIDVAASASGASAVWSAVRVTRRVTIPVPDVVGRPLDEAKARVEASGLEPTEDKGGGLLEPLLPGAWTVCETSPSAGAEVRRGTEVRLSALKGC
jgi:Glucodextranase, domain B/PASTA domain